MNSVTDAIKRVLDGARNLLTGEPARVIGYGAAVVIYLVAQAVGTIPDQTFDEAILSAGAALAVIASVVETIRRYVYSPNTVEAIVAELGEDQT
jgi:hypothetical protein